MRQLNARSSITLSLLATASIALLASSTAVARPLAEVSPKWACTFKDDPEDIARMASTSCSVERRECHGATRSLFVDTDTITIDFAAGTIHESSERQIRSNVREALSPEKLKNLEESKDFGLAPYDATIASVVTTPRRKALSKPGKGEMLHITYPSQYGGLSVLTILDMGTQAALSTPYVLGDGMSIDQGFGVCHPL